MLCTQCGTENEEMLTFCQKCGALFPSRGLTPPLWGGYAVLWFLGVWSAIVGLNILRGETNLSNRMAGLVFLLPLLAALAITYIWRGSLPFWPHRSAPAPPE
ncbi:MAG: zinc ribbon domain-containing protein, partial [Euryarchaeota archaeon]|nr:zinc ribbon domain-containing protein [Euryarchaeota archaeon]